jgi:hypothetical protein
LVRNDDRLTGGIVAEVKFVYGTVGCGVLRVHVRPRAEGQRIRNSDSPGEKRLAIGPESTRVNRCQRADADGADRRR